MLFTSARNKTHYSLGMSLRGTSGWISCFIDCLSVFVIRHISLYLHLLLFITSSLAVTNLQPHSTAEFKPFFFKLDFEDCFISCQREISNRLALNSFLLGILYHFLGFFVWVTLKSETKEIFYWKGISSSGGEEKWKKLFFWFIFVASSGLCRWRKKFSFKSKISFIPPIV